MGDVAMDRTETISVEAILRDELARENRALRGVAPVISHMLESSGHALVSDAIVARVRGMLGDLARQMLAHGHPSQPREPAGQDKVDALAAALASDNHLLNHLYANAMEGHLTERLEHRSSVDPVLSPLLQELIASDTPLVAELAMATLAAQSRFMQNQRRMAIPLGELPSDLFALAIRRFMSAKLGLDQDQLVTTGRSQKAGYDEGAGRLALLTRLVMAMGKGAVAALELDHAGLALFVSAIASRSRQPRDLAVLGCHEHQAARLALSLRAAGLDPEGVERQFLLLEPAEMLPEGLASVSSERARELLAALELGDSFAEAAA